MTRDKTEKTWKENSMQPPFVRPTISLYG